MIYFLLSFVLLPILISGGSAGLWIIFMGLCQAGRGIISIGFFLGMLCLIFMLGVCIWEIGIGASSAIMLGSFLFMHFLSKKRTAEYSFSEIATTTMTGFLALVFTAYRIFYFGLLSCAIPFSIYMIGWYVGLIPEGEKSSEWLILANVIFGACGGVYFGVVRIWMLKSGPSEQAN